MQEKKDKKFFILTIIVLLILLASRIFFSPVVAGDEFINYYNTVKIFNGEQMWKEVNIITTPFIYLLGCAIFKIFGTQLIVYRLYNLILNIILFLLIYKTFRNLNINKKSSLIYTSILEIPIISYVTLWGVTYNVVAVIFVLMGINLDLKRKEIKCYNLCQGIVMFLVFFTKHNIGVYYAISQIIIELLIEEKKKKFTNLIKQFSIFFIGILIFIFMLYKSDLLEAFIDMSIMGISEFSSNITISRVPFIVTLGALVLSGILIYKKAYDTKNKNNIIILFVSGIIMLLLAYPIADTWHIILASLILYIGTIYILDSNAIKLNSNKILLCINSYLMLFFLLNSFYNITCIKNEIIEFDFNEASAFYLSFVKNPKSVNKIENFIKSQNGEVLMVSPEAGIYNLKLNLDSRGFYDEPFNGNLGSNQLNKMINGLENYENYYILIHTNKKYLQEIVEFREYIEKNYNKVGEIENFSIYKK